MDGDIDCHKGSWIGFGEPHRDVPCSIEREREETEALTGDPFFVPEVTGRRGDAVKVGLVEKDDGVEEPSRAAGGEVEDDGQGGEDEGGNQMEAKRGTGIDR